MHFVIRGMPFEAFEAAARGPLVHPKLAQSIAKRGEKASNWLESDWERAKKKLLAERRTSSDRPNRTPQQADPREVRDSWVRSLRGADLHSGDRAVAEVILGLASTNGSTVVGLSVRDLARRVGTGKSAAQRRLARLIQSSMIADVTDVKIGPAANRYELLHADRWDPVLIGTVCSSPSLGGVGFQTVPLATVPNAALQLAHDHAADVWAARVIGQTGRLAYVALLGEGEATTRQVADACGVQPDRATRILRRLEVAGLARQLAKGRWVAEHVDPETAAKRAGSAGVGRRRARQVQIEQRDDALRLLMHRIDAKLSAGELIPLPTSRRSDGCVVSELMAAA